MTDLMLHHEIDSNSILVKIRIKCMLESEIRMKLYLLTY